MGDLLLIVEGRDDIYVVSELLKDHNLTSLRVAKDTGIYPLKLLFDKVPLDIIPAGSVDRAIEQFETRLKHGSDSPKAVGLIIDFDLPSGTQANNRDVTVQNVIANLQNNECHWNLQSGFTVLSHGGFIAEPANADTPRIGVWFMPNNRERGMLETFLHGLIPEAQVKLLDHARNSTDTAKREYQAPFKLVHQDKATVHTFLAWMDEPGHPFGQSFKNGSFDAKLAPACLFIEWIEKLFS